VAGGDPPLACVVLKDVLIVPPDVFDGITSNAVGRNANEPLSVVAADEIPAGAAADDQQVSRSIFEDGAGSTESIRVGESRDAAARELRSAAACAQPQIAVTVL
jgi:hypothetical protein